MHNYQCCSICLQAINSYRNKYQSVLLDYTNLKEKTKLLYNAQQIYYNQNVDLNRIKLDQAAYIRVLQSKLQTFQANHNLPNGSYQNINQLENERFRRDTLKVEELSKTVDIKNKEITRTKTEISNKNNEISALRKDNQLINMKVQQLNQTIQRKNIQSLQKRQQLHSFKSQQKYQDRTKCSSNIDQSIENYQPRSKLLNKYGSNQEQYDRNSYSQSDLRLYIIQQKIKQLEHQNDKLRTKLITKI